MVTSLPHGHYNRYRKYGCRCKECVAANRKYNKERRDRRAATVTGNEAWHGTLNGYTSYNCRCHACKRVKAAYKRGEEWMRQMWPGEDHPSKLSTEHLALTKRNQKARRNALKLTSLVTKFTPRQLAERMSVFGCCWMCGTPEWTDIEHVKPLSRGGAHMLGNLRPACAPCNREKWDTWPYVSKIHITP